MYRTIAPLVVASKVGLVPVERRKLFAQVGEKEEIEDNFRGWWCALLKYGSLRVVNHQIASRKLFFDSTNPTWIVIAKTVMAGVMQALTLEPLDCIMTRHMLQDSGSIGKTFTDLFQSKVPLLKALYAGLVPAILQIMSFRVLHYGLSVLTWHIVKTFGLSRYKILFLMFQGILSQMISYPLDTIRVRAEKECMLKKKKYKTLWEHFREARNGWRSLYAGVGYTVIPIMVTYGLTVLHPYILRLFK